MDKSIVSSEKWLKTIIEASPDAIIVTDLDGIILDCNQAALDLSALRSKEELIGLNGLNTIHPEDRERIKRDVKNLLLNGMIKDTEYRVLNRNAEIFPVEISASTIFDKNDNPNAFVCILKDITKRKDVENNLKYT